MSRRFTLFRIEPGMMRHDHVLVENCEDPAAHRAALQQQVDHAVWTRHSISEPAFFDEVGEVIAELDRRAGRAFVEMPPQPEPDITYRRWKHPLA